MEQSVISEKEEGESLQNIEKKMKEMNIDLQQGMQPEIDLIEWGKYIWMERMFFLKLVVFSIVASLIVSFSIPKEYTTVVKLAPETEDATKKAGSLGGLAAMAGINLNATGGTDAISPNLYPDVVSSTPFLLELFDVPVTDRKKIRSTSLYNYMAEYQQVAWWIPVLGAPFKLIDFLKGLFREKANEVSVVDPFCLTMKQWNVVNGLKERIGVEMDKKTFTITLSVRMQDPVVSAEVMKAVQKKLQDYITTYRTRKAKNDLAFTQKVLEEARTSYYKAQQTYASFEDTNRNIISSSYRTEQERLRNEMSLAFNVYNTLAQKLEQDKLRVQEQTPAYTVIEPAIVPLVASSPRKMLILIGFVFLSFWGGIGYLFVRNLFFTGKNS